MPGISLNRPALYYSPNQGWIWSVLLAVFAELGYGSCPQSEGVLTSQGQRVLSETSFPMPAGISPVLHPSSWLIPAASFLLLMPQLDLGLLAAIASSGCCSAVRFCTFSEQSLNFSLWPHNAEEKTFVPPACRLASAVQCEGVLLTAVWMQVIKAKWPEQWLLEELWWLRKVYV